MALDFGAHYEKERARIADDAATMTKEALGVWEADLFRRWAAAAPSHRVRAIPRGEELLRAAENTVGAEEGTALLQQLANARMPTAATLAHVQLDFSNEAAIAAGSITEDEAARVEGEPVLRAMELVLRLRCEQWDIPATTDICDGMQRQLLRALQSLETKGVLKAEAGHYPELFAAYTIHAVAVSLNHRPATRRGLSAQGRAACRLFPTAASHAMIDALRELDGPGGDRYDTQHIYALAAAAIRSIPLAFPHETTAALRRLLPLYEPSTYSPIAPTYVPSASAVVDSPTVGDQMLMARAARARPASHTATAERQTSAALSSEPAPRPPQVQIVVEPPAVAVGDETLLPTRPTIVLGDRRPRSRPRSPPTATDDLQAAPAPPQPPAALQLSSRLPTSVLAEAARPAPQHVTEAAAAAPSGRVATPSSLYPCRSKYHQRYSRPEKHGSRDCPFCVVCHMMEFLFNGCRTDCIWRHKPTAKKISLHLAPFPPVLGLAKARSEEFMQVGYIAPMDIPLE